MSVTVLRIKRKATSLPLDSLIIQGHDDTSSSSHPTKSRKTAGGDTPRGSRNGVFRLAETVRRGWEGEGREGEELKHRIQQLMTQHTTTPPTTLLSASAPSSSSAPPPPPPPPSVAPLLPSVGKRYRIVKPVPLLRNHRRDRGINRWDDSPPVIRDTSIQQQQQQPLPLSNLPQLKFIDAQEINTPIPSRSQTPNRGWNQREGKGEGGEDEERYLALLAEAMGLSDQSSKSSTRLQPPSPPRPTPPSSTQPPIPILLPPPTNPNSSNPPQPSILSTPLSSSNTTPKIEEDDFVYDLYYRDLRDSDGGDGDGGGFGGGAGVGVVAGWEELEEEEESEEADEADEDSNDEDFYRNDYPEDEDASSSISASSEPDRETYIQQRGNRYRYGDEMDGNRDGFEDEDAGERPLVMKSFKEVFGIGIGEMNRNDGARGKGRGRGVAGEEDDEDEDEEEGGDEDDDDDHDQRMGEWDADEEEVGDVEEWQVMTGD